MFYARCYRKYNTEYIKIIVLKDLAMYYMCLFSSEITLGNIAHTYVFYA
jgi:hypothetical protein